VAVQFTIICDGCGRFIGSSRSSIRAARAEAQMNRGANHGPDGDQCVDCRRKRIAEFSERATSRAHGVSRSVAGRLTNWTERNPVQVNSRRNASASSGHSKPMTVARAFVSNSTNEDAWQQIHMAMRCSGCFSL